MFQIGNILNTMVHCEVNSFVTKFKYLWHAGIKASLMDKLLYYILLVLVPFLLHIMPMDLMDSLLAIKGAHYIIADNNGDEQLEKLLTKPH